MNEGKLTEFQKIKLPKGKAKVVKTSNGWELLINNGKTTFTLDLGNKDRKFRFKGNKLNTTEKDAINFSKKLMKHSDFKGLKLIEGKLTSEQKLRESIREIIKEQLNEAITGADRKILFILIREIVRNLKSKIKNMDVNNKSHLNRVGSSILAIIRAMSYSPDNVNYKNFKKYFPKGFNSKLIQKKLKQFHSQNDKVQVTLVTQAIKNELGAGVKEGKLTEQKFKKVILPNDMKTKVKVSKIIKKMKLKIDKDYDVKALKARGGDQELLLLPKHYNKFIELAMQNKLNPRG